MGNTNTKSISLTKSEHLELEFILNFYLYEDGLEHNQSQIKKVESIKAKLGYKQGEQ